MKNLKILISSIDTIAHNLLSESLAGLDYWSRKWEDFYNYSIEH